MDIRFLTVQDIFLQEQDEIIKYISHIKVFTNTSKVLSWNSIGLSEESVENITTSDSNFAQTLIIIHYQT